jgi:uncharacterized peroxidase-related enzyme
MSEVVHEFTVDVLDWSPYVTPIDYETASDEQRSALKITPSNTKISAYVLVLAHDPQSLESRSPLFNLIMMGREKLGRAERELGAVGASIVNGCVYCTSVHARAFNTFSKRPEVIEEIFAHGTKAQLDGRDAAIFDFAARLSENPPAAEAADIARLRNAGLNEEEIVDLIHSAALFGWANRLMHTLGEPVRKG